MRAFLADVATRVAGRLRAVRNRGFRARLRRDAEAPMAVEVPGRH